MLAINNVDEIAVGPHHRYAYRDLHINGYWWWSDDESRWSEEEVGTRGFEGLQAFFLEELYASDPASILWDDPDASVED